MRSTDEHMPCLTESAMLAGTVSLEEEVVLFSGWRACEDPSNAICARSTQPSLEVPCILALSVLRHDPP